MKNSKTKYSFRVFFELVLFVLLVAFAGGILCVSGTHNNELNQLPLPVYMVAIIAFVVIEEVLIDAIMTNRNRRKYNSENSTSAVQCMSTEKCIHRETEMCAGCELNNVVIEERNRMIQAEQRKLAEQKKEEYKKEEKLKKKGGRNCYVPLNK